jgi:hypothetical protein
MQRHSVPAIGFELAREQKLARTWHEISPQEVWWALEDLWLRLSALGLLTLESGHAVVVVRSLREAKVSAAGELRSIALDAETYQLRQGGRIWSFARTLDYRGQDLVCELTSVAAIARWPDGEGLALQVRGFMARLAAIERHARGEGARP